MADITSSVAIAFCNNFLRKAADKRAQDYFFAKGILAEWNALGGSALIPNDSSAIRDAANPVSGNGDGRPQITGAMANNVINRCSEIITDFEASSNAKLGTVLQVSVNPLG